MDLGAYTQIEDIDNIAKANINLDKAEGEVLKCGKKSQVNVIGRMLCW